jgi:RNA polymerase sigma factor (sigma-70 family)
MAGSPSDRVLRQVQRLFNIGAVGTMSDAELLDRFVSRRDEVAEAAFEELVIRHGPMVLRVCRGLLHDAHDAEDAFQAVFLVLTNRARSIRRSASVASWLFGVAHRVAMQGKRGAARRRALDQLVAEQTSESYLPSADDPDGAILHEEIDRLPERLRAPVVLCYLQGLTYAQAAHRLGLSSVAIQGRLARARERLRQRLIRRGVTVPAGLVVAGAASQAQAAVPLTLIQGTTRMAMGFMAGHTAAVLARGVLTSMMLNQLKVATVLLCLGIGVSYWTWHAFAGPAVQQGRPDQGKVAPIPASSPRPEPTQPTVTYRLTGSVRVEGTGEPAAGALVDVMIADSGKGHLGTNRTTISGADGRYTVDLPPGTARVGTNRTTISGADGRYTVDLPPGSARTWRLIAPVGYWAPRDSQKSEEFVVSRDEPVYRKDYLVRRGNVWDFRIARTHDAKPVQGVITAFDKGEFFQSAVDDTGRVRLTLPIEEGRVEVLAREKLIAAQWVGITLEWKSGFRPDHVASVTNLGSSPAQYRLSDRDGKTATIAVPDKVRAEPRLDGGKLVVEVKLPEPDPKAFGDLTGKLVDTSGKPLAGALVALIQVDEEHGSSGMSAQDQHSAETDAQGHFRLRSIPRAGSTGKPVTIGLAITKEGYVGVDTKRVHFQPGASNPSQVAETVTLAPGVSVSGTVVDPQGKPLAGVWIEPGGSFAIGSRFTKTDDAGRFTVRDLPTGMVPFSFHYGKLMAQGDYLARRDASPLTIKLHPAPDAATLQARSDAAQAARDRTKPLALGTPAPEWESGAWSDGRARKLADYRGKVVVLNFWGIWCGACLGELPSLEKLRAKFEPLGVVFLTLHTPGENEKTVREVLEMNKASLIFAFDRDRTRDEIFEPNGVTAERYGVSGYPTLVMIDRQGNVAFDSGRPKQGVDAMLALGKEMGLDESTMTEKDLYRLWETFFGREIEKVLNRP